MSEIRVDNVKNEAGTGAPTFPNGAIIVGNVGSTSLNITGVSTLGNTVVGGATTQVVINGNLRVTGIITTGTSSITIDPINDQIKVGSATTIGVTGFNVGSSNLHSTGLDLGTGNVTSHNINSTGIITASQFRVGTAVTVNSSGVTVTGVITATSFSGSGANLTGIAATTDVRTNSLVVSGITTVAAGSAAAPSITPTGDSNTGIFFPSADTIAFGEGGSEAARIASSGGFGIGVTIPGYRLDVQDAINIRKDGSDNSYLYLNGTATRIGYNDATGNLRFFTNSQERAYVGYGGGFFVLSALSVGGNVTLSGGDRSIINNDTNALIFGTNGTERARIDSSGRFGLGSATNLGYKLNIYESGSGMMNALHLGSGGGTAGNGASISFGLGNGFDPTANILAKIGGIYTGGGYDGALTFSTCSSAAQGINPPERARIDSSGRLLVGMSSYTGNGTIVAQGHSGSSTGPAHVLLKRGTTSPSDGEDFGYLFFSDANTSGGFGAWIVGQRDGGTWTSGSSMPGRLVFATTANGASSPTERARIDSTGRLSINGAATQIARLQVNHNATDQYGIYVPGGIYTGTGFAGINYGGYFSSNTSNSGVTQQIGVFGTITNGPANFGYGGYFDGGSEATNQRIGVYGTARQSDVNGPAQQVGGWFNVNTAGAGAGSLGSTVALRAENTSTLGSASIGVRVTTVAGATTVNGHQYEHAGAVVFRVKSNGGIDNFSANNTNLSDIREKKNIENLDSTWNCLKHWELKKFHYNEDADTDNLRYGVIAQQIVSYCPEVIGEWTKQSAEPAKFDVNGNEIEPAQEEIVRMGVKEQQMYWMAIKALQEAQERIETLESQNTIQASAIEALTSRLDAAGL